MAQSETPSPGQFQRCVWTTAGQTRVALSTSTAPSAVLTPGHLYIVCADVAWHMRQGRFSATQVAATTNGLPLSAYEKIYVWVTAADVDDCVAGILDAGTGYMYVCEAS